MADVGLSVAFWPIAALTVVAALAVVSLKNLLHAALALVLSFVGVAAVYVTLRADFVAAVQILIYAGAIAVLILFGILLTGNAIVGNPPNRLRLPAVALSVSLAGLLVWVVSVRTVWPVDAQGGDERLTPVSLIADALFNRFVLPFEVASVMLLAAMLGAIVLTRQD